MKNLIFRYCTSATSEKIIPRWEQDYRLQPYAKLGLFYEYLEMGKRQTALRVQLLTQLLEAPLSGGHVQPLFDINVLNVTVIPPVSIGWRAPPALAGAKKGGLVV